MSKLNRRQFIGAAFAATSASVVGGVVINKAFDSKTLEAAPALIIDKSIKSPTDKVQLGKSALKVSVVGIGTGSIGYGRHSESDTSRSGRLHTIDEALFGSRR